MGVLRVAMDDPGWPWVSRWGGASIRASPRVSWGDEASDGASPCESRRQVRGIPGWWS